METIPPKNALNTVRKIRKGIKNHPDDKFLEESGRKAVDFFDKKGYLPKGINKVLKHLNKIGNKKSKNQQGQ